MMLCLLAALAWAQTEAPILRAVRDESAGAVKTLLRGGANPNAVDSRGATALMWAIPDLEKVRVLLSVSADVNARSTNRGLTPLLIAASYPGTVEILKLLLDKGADLRAKDRNGRNALSLAAESADLSVVRFLVERGLDAKDPGLLRRSVLARRYLPALEYLLAQGARIQPRDLALMTHQETGIVARFAAQVSDVNAANGTFRRTPLINAAASEEPAVLSTLRLLLEKGADPNVADQDGETPLDWAMHRADPERIELLSKHGGKPAPTPRDAEFPAPEGALEARTAVERAVAALLRAGPPVFAKRACITCHNQTLPAQAAFLARAKGIAVDEKSLDLNFRQMAASYKPVGEEAMQGLSVPGQELTVGYVAMALAAGRHAPDAMTAGLFHVVASRQMPDGSWPEFETRPPMEYSSISRTAMAVRMLTLYPIAGRARKTGDQLRKARAWLMAARPASAEEYAMRLMGLAWVKAPVKRELEAWKARQRADGGWSQLPHLPSDAYATGITLFAFQEAGLPVTDAAYRKAVAYLLKTQYANGAWFVRTRSFPVQPQFESGFPFGYHQWISAAATAWASLAIAYTLPDQRP